MGADPSLVGAIGQVISTMYVDDFDDSNGVSTLDSRNEVGCIKR